MGQYLKMDITVPDEYIEGFTKANNTFLYQLVFDPLKRKVVPLNPYPNHIDPASLSYAGTYLLHYWILIKQELLILYIHLIKMNQLTVLAWQMQKLFLKLILSVNVCWCCKALFDCKFNLTE